MAKVVGLSIDIGADTKQFEREMRKVNKTVRDTTNEVGTLTQALDIDFNAGRFEQAQIKAREALEMTDQKAETLRQRLKYLEDAGEVNTDHYKRVQNELVLTESKAVLLKRRLDEIRNLKIDQLAGQFEKVGQGITKAGQAFTPVSAAATALLASFVAISNSTVKAADDIGTMAAQLNLSAEAMQRWNYIAMQTDVQQSELQAAFRKTQGALADLTMGETSPAADALLALNISSEQAAKGMGANIDLIIERLSAIQDPVIQAGIANELFGDKLGARLIPLLNAGSAGLAQLTSEFEALGFMTNEQVAALSEFDNVMNRIKQTFINLKNDIGVALLPTMESIARLIEERIVPAVRQAVDWFASLTDSQREIILTVLAVTAAIAPALLIVGKLTAAIGGVIRVASGLGQALSFLAAHPIIAIIGAVVALLGYLYTTNEQFRESINGLIGAIGSALAPVFENLMNVIQAVLQSVMPLVGMIGDLLVPVIGVLQGILEPLVRTLSLVLVPVFKVLSTAIQTIAKVLEPVIWLITTILTPAIEIFGKIVNAVFKGVETAVFSFVKSIEDAINFVINRVNAVIRLLNVLGDVLGYELNEIANADLLGGAIEQKVTVEDGTTTPTVTTPQSTATKAADAIATVPTQVITNNTTNSTTDNSVKNLTVNLTIENFADELDYDDIVNRIQIKLAEAM